MMPRLGKNLKLVVEASSRPRVEYQSSEYARLGLPKAPAIMIGNEVLVEGQDIEEAEIEKRVRRWLAAKSNQVEG